MTARTTGHATGQATYPALDPLPTIGVLGGTGALGNGLVRRWAAAGLTVSIGSRSADKAKQAASAIEVPAAGTGVRGTSLADCAAQSDVVVVAVPWEAHAATCEQIRDSVAGKVVIDVVNPLGFDKQGPYSLPVAEGSAAQQAQALLPDARVVAAFHHVSAVLLADLAVDKVETDVMVLGDQRESTDLVQRLVELIPGMRGIYSGRLRNAAQVEALTANLIAVNRRYKTHAGIALTNVL